MYFLTYKDNGVKYPLVRYGKLDYLSGLLLDNEDKAKRYVNKGNWILENQNPLIQFIVNMEIDIDWNDEFIYNHIRAKYLSVSSLCEFTSLRNPGSSHIHTVFPEKEHHVLITTPFGEPEYNWEYYFKEEAYQNLIPLKTIFTTDVMQRWAVHEMTTHGNVTRGESTYTVVQLDPFALVIGYVRYYRDRVKQGLYLGLTPAAYLSKYPLVNFYFQHNLMVAVNYGVDGITDIPIDKPKWTLMPYSRFMGDYAQFIKSTMFAVNPDSIHHFLQQSYQLNPNGVATDGFYPKQGLSDQFLQLGWVYSYSAMRVALSYCKYLDSVGKDDTAFKSTVKRFLRNDLGTLTSKIRNPLWKALFARMFKDLKEKIK